MITVIKKKYLPAGRQGFQRLNSRLGQHTAEFLILFLALAVVFVSTRLYLRRGVNAKLKLIEDQLNEAVVGPGVTGAGDVFLKFGLYVEGDDEFVDGCNDREFLVSEAAFEGLKNGTYGRMAVSGCFIHQCLPNLASGWWYDARITGPDYDTDWFALVWNSSSDHSWCEGAGF